MLPELFITWLRGYIAAAGTNGLTPEQVAVIVKELESVQMRGPYRAR